MGPLWVLLAEGWWAVPAGVAAAATGTATWIGVRTARARRRTPRITARDRRLELDAARHEVSRSRTALARAKAAVPAARAVVARTQAERGAGRASSAELAAARHELKQAQQEAAAASADLTARVADLRSARASVPARSEGREALPLHRLVATHDAINAEWVSYEIDPGKATTYPSVTDAREPLTIAFLREQQQAQWLRPSTSTPSASTPRVAPADYAAYREAVRRMARAFAVLERDAWRRAGEPRGSDGPGEGWWGIAQGLWDGASRTIAWSAEAVARAQEAWPKKRPPAP